MMYDCSITLAISCSTVITMNAASPAKWSSKLKSRFLYTWRITTRRTSCSAIGRKMKGSEKRYTSAGRYRLVKTTWWTMRQSQPNSATSTPMSSAVAALSSVISTVSSSEPSPEHASPAVPTRSASTSASVVRLRLGRAYAIPRSTTVEESARRLHPNTLSMSSSFENISPSTSVMLTGRHRSAAWRVSFITKCSVSSLATW